MPSSNFSIGVTVGTVSSEELRGWGQAENTKWCEEGKIYKANDSCTQWFRKR